VREGAHRAAVQGALAPVQKDQWWDQAQPKDIGQVHALAEGWKEYDPAALAAAERIRTEVQRRYGIDTRDVGADATYLESGLESGIETINAEQARRAAVAEHQKGMALIAAAQAEELRAKAEKLAPQIEKHQVPLEYLNNTALSQAVQGAHDAKTPDAIEAADTRVGPPDKWPPLQRSRGCHNEPVGICYQLQRRSGTAHDCSFPGASPGSRIQHRENFE
jgi:hypothetical protein